MLEQYLDSWELQYVRGLKDNDVMAWADPQAKLMYPKHSWVYDKLLLSSYTGVETWNLEDGLPDKYPVIVKPRENLFGLSKNCYIAHSEDEVEDFVGYIAQEILTGMQLSTDLCIVDGNVAANYGFTTHKNSYGEIKLFTSTPFPQHSFDGLEEILKGYTGIANVETVGGKIIEVHLRPSLQFYDICGGFIEQMPEFITKGVLPKVSYERTYSRVFRTRHDGYVSKAHIPSQKPPGVRSIQLCWTDGYKLSESDPGLIRHRYMVINGTDLTEIEKFGRMVRIHLKEEK